MNNNQINYQNLNNNSQQVNNSIATYNNQQVNNNNSIQNIQQPIIPSNNNKIPKKEKGPKESLRNFFMFLIFVGIVIIGISIYLLIDNNKKYNTYIPMAADLISQEKVTKGGIEYYQGTYKYIIEKKEYFYKSKKLYSNTPDKIIQIKYNKSDPTTLYNEDASKLYFIILFSGIGLSFISMIIAISLSSSKLKEIITTQVIEQVTCVGGRRIYLVNINTINTQTEDNKYYVYFTNDLKKFAIGNKLSFNLYQYSEVFTTEKYRNTTAKTLYNFQNDDFTLINTNQN